MLWVILTLAFIVLGGIVWWIHRKENRSWLDDWNIKNYGQLSVVVGLCFLVFGVGISGVYDIINHKFDYRTLEKLDNNSQLFKRRAESIGKILSIELTKYPEYEKEIFDKIKPSELMDFFAVRYPDLKSSETMIVLAKELAELQSRIYDIDLEYNGVVVKILNRQNNRLVYSPFIPMYDVEYVN